MSDAPGRTPPQIPRTPGQPPTLVIGTHLMSGLPNGPGYARFRGRGCRYRSRGPVGYEEGSTGWVVDQPTFRFPDGSAMRTRLTAVWRQEDGVWKLVHMHVSVGVPDDEVVGLQERWSSTS